MPVDDYCDDGFVGVVYENNDSETVSVNVRLIFALFLLVILGVFFFYYIFGLGINCAHVICTICIRALAIKAWKRRGKL